MAASNQESLSDALDRLQKTMARLADEVERLGPSALGLGGDLAPGPHGFAVASLGKGQGYGTLDQTGNFSGSFFTEKAAAEQFAAAHKRFYDDLAAKLAPPSTPARMAPLGAAVAAALGAGPASAALPASSPAPATDPGDATPDSPLATAAGWARARAGGPRTSAYRWRRGMDARAAAQRRIGTALARFGASGPGVRVPGSADNPIDVSGGLVGTTGGGLGGNRASAAAPPPIRATNFRPGSAGSRGRRARGSRAYRWARAGFNRRRRGAGAAFAAAWGGGAGGRGGGGGFAGGFAAAGGGNWRYGAGHAAQAAGAAAGAAFPGIAAGVGAVTPILGNLASLAQMTLRAAQEMRHFAEDANQANRGLSRYNSGISAAFQQLDRGQYYRDVRMANAVQGTATTLARSVDAMRSNWEGFDQVTQDARNRAGGFAAAAAGQFGNALSNLARPVGAAIEAVDPKGINSVGVGAAFGASVLGGIDPFRLFTNSPATAAQQAQAAAQAPGTFGDRWGSGMHAMVKLGPIRGKREMPVFGP